VRSSALKAAAAWAAAEPNTDDRPKPAVSTNRPGPFSYWDRAQGAMWIAPMEFALALVAFAVLLRRRIPAWAIAVAGLMMLAEGWIVFQWIFVFAA
ncbi:MAG: hypothetical protein AAF329_26095, partial [Cyanobacteria bacterium P01_A01_bin.17]